jgi:starch phosphorylase
VRWIPGREIKGTAYDTPIVGYRVNTCNTLRLWKAEAVESFDFQDFNVGDYYGAVEEKVVSETVTKVLYPNDEQKAAARAAILFRLLLPPGHDATSRSDGWEARDVS